MLIHHVSSRCLSHLTSIGLTRSPLESTSCPTVLTATLSSLSSKPYSSPCTRNPEPTVLTLLERDPLRITKKVAAGVHQGVTTVELDNLAAETAAYLTTKHPDYAILAARIAISNLHKETKKTFSTVVHDLYTWGESGLDSKPR